MSKFKVGDKVTPDIDYPGLPEATLGRVFTVAKINPKNIRATADDGGRGINFPEAALLPATPENVNKLTTHRPFVPREFFCAGEIATFVRPPNGHSAESPFVVLKDNGEKVNVALLGGEDDRYWRVPHSGLVKRDLTWLAEALLEKV